MRIRDRVQDGVRVTSKPCRTMVAAKERGIMGEQDYIRLIEELGQDTVEPQQRKTVDEQNGRDLDQRSDEMAALFTKAEKLAA